MASSIKNHAVQSAAYKTSNRSHTNRLKKLERHVKRFPDDQQAKSALKSGIVTYRRKTPNSRVWSGPKRVYAQMLKFTGSNGHLAIMSQQEIDRRAKRKSH